ncbi:MAG: hypothetical protein ACOX6V_04900 [Patescibacteria group bacterium]|jgi:hypothetical protein
MKPFTKLPVFIAVYFLSGLVMALPILQSQLYNRLEVWLPVILWLAGGMFGYVVLSLDRIIDIYITHPNTKLAGYVKQLVSQGWYRQAWQVIQANKHLQPRLVFHSVLFQAIWVFLALFTVTSTFQLFGQGFVLGLGLHLLLEEWQEYNKDKEKLKQWLFWQLNLTLSDRDVKWYLLAISILITTFFLMVIL